MAMYEENARKISGTMAAINPAAAADIIPLGRVDAMLAISERLRGGNFVGVLGDRTLAQEPMQAVTLLGERAYLPTGPMRLAALLGCSVMFMAGLYPRCEPLPCAVRAARRFFVRGPRGSRRGGGRGDRPLCGPPRPLLPQ